MKLIITLTFLQCSVLAICQNTFPSSGNVGIGTISPQSDLEITSGGSSASLKLRHTNEPLSMFGVNLFQNSDRSGHLECSGCDLQINSGWGEKLILGHEQYANNGGGIVIPAGKVGIGTSTPQNKLHVKGDWNVLRVHSDTEDVGIDFKNAVSPNRANIRYDGGSAGFEFRTNGTNQAATKFYIGDDGKVGVGTYTPDALFTVKGEIHAEAVNVDLNVPGPDYVFEEDYDLRTLEETEAYIKTHKHLPEVPSAKEMAEQGIDLVEMNMLLLKKVEELTLYSITQQKLINQLLEGSDGNNIRLDEKVEELTLHVTDLQQQINQLKN